jgi:hypothetical protein
VNQLANSIDDLVQSSRKCRVFGNTPVQSERGGVEEAPGVPLVELLE